VQRQTKRGTRMRRKQIVTPVYLKLSLMRRHSHPHKADGLSYQTRNKPSLLMLRKIAVKFGRGLHIKHEIIYLVHFGSSFAVLCRGLEFSKAIIAHLKRNIN
jgi:hypothetical protein